jgi:hypothetical protein
MDLGVAAPLLRRLCGDRRLQRLLVTLGVRE